MVALVVILATPLGCSGSGATFAGGNDPSPDGGAPQDDGSAGSLDGGGGGDGASESGATGDDAGTASGGDADASNNGPPSITILDPPVNTTLPCRTTPTFDFSASVKFGAPFQSVTFDYKNPRTGTLAPQQMTFSAYASPFVQTVRIGGLNSLCAEQKSIGAWQFIVTATDTQGQSVTATRDFALSLQ